MFRVFLQVMSSWHISRNEFSVCFPFRCQENLLLLRWPLFPSFPQMQGMATGTTPHKDAAQCCFPATGIKMEDLATLQTSQVLMKHVFFEDYTHENCHDNGKTTIWKIYFLINIFVLGGGWNMFVFFLEPFNWWCYLFGKLMGLGPELLIRLMESRTTVNYLDMVIYIRNKQTMIDAKCI